MPGEAPPPGYAPPPAAGPQYSAPPPGGYQPPGGYPPAGAPGMGVPPAGYASADDKTWALIAHFGGAAGMLVGVGTGGWVAPLIALLAKGNQSPTVRAHAIAALNFQLLWSIISVVGWLTVCIAIGFIIWPIAMIIGIIFGILGGVKANEGQLYTYPLSVSMIK
jgi:uncharacterized protein